MDPYALCHGCGGTFEPYEENPVIYDCFHALHAECANVGTDAFPHCGAAPEAADYVGGGGGGAGPPGSSSVDVDVTGNGGGGDDHYNASEYDTFYSPQYTPSPSLPPLHHDQFQQPPPAMAGPSQFQQFGYPAPSRTSQFETPYYYYSNNLPVPPVGPPPPSYYRAPLLPSQYPFKTSLSEYQQQQPSAAPSHYPYQTSTSEYQQQQPPASYYPYKTSASEYQQQQQQQPAAAAPAFFAYAPPATAASSCVVCGGPVVRGQTAVTSQCGHKFHFCCFSRSVYTCPACGAQWQDLIPTYRY